MSISGTSCTAITHTCIESLCSFNGRDLNESSGDEREPPFRTVTRAFLATDSLRGGEVVHLACHYWESYFYVLVWIATPYGCGGEAGSDMLGQQTSLDDTNHPT